MNESPSPEFTPLPNQTASPHASSAFGTPLSAARPAATSRLIYPVLLILALLLAAQWWSTRGQLSKLRGELAQRLQSADNINNETKVLTRSTQESVKELQAKVSVLDSKQTEAQSEQLALEQLYQELSKNRDDWALAEVEQVLSTASQQLQLAGNVQGALIALQNADRSLSRSDKPQFITIRRAIARDQEKLKALPVVDLTGLALRLDSAIDQVDFMPLLSDEKPALPATEPKPVRQRQSSPSGSVRSTASDWIGTLQNKWDSWSNETWRELRQLIRVRDVQTPDALLLSPTQAFYARENLKLRLLSARLSLLARNESTFRSDMIAAQETITKYFDTRAKHTQTAQALLKQVQNSNLAIEMPTLADSLTALRNYKAKP